MKVKSKRLIQYKDPIPVYDLTINEETPCFALEAGVISHNTKRWKSKSHTVPPGSELMDLRISRYNDGVLFHWDYCWHKDTRIKLLDGRIFTVEELSKIPAKDLFTFSDDTPLSRVNGLVPGSIKSVTKMYRAKKLLKITLDNGYELKLTHNHKLFKNNTNKAEAQDLVVGDSLLSIYSRINTSYIHNGYEELRITCQKRKHVYHLTHKLIWGVYTNYKYDKGYIHHKDHVRENNSPINLERMTPAQHMSHHMKESWKNNYDNRLKIIREMHNNPEWRRKIGDASRNSWKTKESFIKRMHEIRLEDRERWYRDLYKSNSNKSHIELRKRGQGRFRDSQTREALKILLNSYTIHHLRQEVAKDPQRWDKMLKILYPERLPRGYGYRAVISGYGSFEKFFLTNQDLHENHSIVSIEEIEYNDWVYNVEIYDAHHNYFVCANEEGTEHILSSNSQNEVRVMAKVANEENLLAVFDRGEDIHKYMASQTFRIPLNEVTEEQRQYSKRFTFGLLYGKTVFSFATDYLNGDLGKAKKLFSDFYTAFPGIKRFVQGKHWEALQTGSVKTIFGDPLNVDLPEYALQFPDDMKKEICFSEDGLYSKKVQFSENREMNSRMRGKVGKSLRNAQNYAIQSAASHLAAISMDKIKQYVKERGMSSRLFCFTHDAGDMDMQIKDLHETLRILPQLAVDWPRSVFNIPLSIDYEIGVSANQRVKLKDMVFDDKICKGKFSAKQESVARLKNQLEEWGVNMEIGVDKSEKKISSLSQMFTMGRAFSQEIGKPFIQISGTIHFDFNMVRSSRGIS